MFRNQSAQIHQFSMVPRAEVPRSAFRIQRSHKTTFDAGLLVPIFCEEVLPGDSWRVSMTAFCRLATPIYPIMDNAYLETFFFFVPNRLLWKNWHKFMGEQEAPGASTSFVIPTVTSAAGGFPVGSLYDYFGLPTVGQVGGGNTVTVNALPIRAYGFIWQEWFRDQNIANASWARGTSDGDGPDAVGTQGLYRRLKRHDYFTSCLPWPQKATNAVTLPLGTSAPIKTSQTPTVSGALPGLTFNTAAGGAPGNFEVGLSGQLLGTVATATAGFGAGGIYPANLFADLSAATAATINQLRQSFAIQRLLERDARGGTRYVELLKAHFGVVSPDFRLQRPEYLGGGSTPVLVTPVPQTSATGINGGTSPAGNLSGFATALAQGHGFTQSFTEHGYVIGLVNLRADLHYQQGLRKMWSRSTKYDFYWPAFAHLGEQAVLSKEIFCDGSVDDNNVFGYQERWAEYRYSPSMITGLFRSTSAGTLDAWHLAQRFVARPTLNETFLFDTPPLSRVLAGGVAAAGAQVIFDGFFDCQAARPLPMYSVPGMIDHF